VKYMILTYASQQDYDGMSGKPTDKPAWSADDFAAMGAFMESFNRSWSRSTRTWRSPGSLSRREA
jgi:hypothetical protein